MKKVIVVVGYGPGISKGVAEKFGAEGYAVALVGRSAEKLDAGVKALKERGIEAARFVADAGNPAAIREAIAGAHAALGPVAVLHWNAYGGSAGDVLTASAEELRGVFDIPIIGLTEAVKAALPDLKQQKGSVLVTNGGFGLNDAQIDQACVTYNAMGLSIANAAKRKLTGLLAAKLAPEGVYVGEVIVTGTIKGTAFDHGAATLEGATVGEAFWKLHGARTPASVTIG